MRRRERERESGNEKKIEVRRMTTKRIEWEKTEVSKQ
jgi:hypothetical protein